MAEGALRREPSQARGARRVARILDAAAAEFAARGYEAATTNAIAARAETSIGSLYQYFPNKAAILRALAGRYLDGLRAAYAHALAEEAVGLPLPALLDRIVDTLAAFYAANPGFAPIFGAAKGSRELWEAALALYAAVERRTEEVLAAYLPSLSPGRRALHASVIAGVVRAMLPLAVRDDGTLRADMIAELKRLLGLYIVVEVKGESVAEGRR